MILVTGATGNVGTEVVKQLAGAGHKVRALVRDKKDGVKLGTVELAIGDFENLDSLGAAMRGIDTMYQLAPFTPALVAHETNLLDAAKKAGVKRIVKHSVMGAEYESITLGKWHRQIEKKLEASGIAWTHIRPTGFMSNALQWVGSIKAQGAVYYPAGDGKLALVDARDIASCAVVALTQPGHEGKAYAVTGPEALTTQQQCDILGKAIGKSIKYVDVPDSAAKESMVGMGMPAQLVDILLEYTNLVRAGQADQVTDAIPRLTGKPGRTFEAWCRENAAAFK